METEDGADGDLDVDPAQEATDDSPGRPQTSPLTRRAVALVSDIRSDAGQSLELNSDALINSDAGVQGYLPNIIFPVSRVSPLSLIRQVHPFSSRKCRGQGVYALCIDHLASDSCYTCSFTLSFTISLVSSHPACPASPRSKPLAPPAALYNIGL
ncbi:hypothetical protein BC827DRAFT_166090 [Russula dissimulans]|nr:hypothetical protein BC827DRAFT_166090 [Russula dissimulans]